MGNAYSEEYSPDYCPRYLSGLDQDEGEALPPAPLPEPNIIQQAVAKVPGGWVGVLCIGLLGWWGFNKARDEGWF